MRYSFWDKRIPTLLGLFLIIVGIGITSLLVKNGVIFTGHAGPTDAPQHVIISNLSPTSITISYTTLDTVVGSIAYGTTKTLGQLQIDNRDQLPHTVSPHRTHIVTLTKLSPKTTYYFSIISGQKTFAHDGEPYQITTAPFLDTALPENKKITGKVLGAGQSQTPDALIEITIPHAQTIVTVPDQNGNFTVPATSLRTSDLLSYYTIPPDAMIHLAITDGIFSSQVSFSPKDGEEIPTIVLSKDYDFATLEAPVASPSALANIQPVFTLLNPTPKQTPVTLQIVSPKQEQGLTDTQPVFKGIAPPGSTVTVIIHSANTIQTQILADQNGNWVFRPQQALAPGLHTITIQTKDTLGMIKSVTQTFTVFESGTQVNQSATRSALLTITASPSPSSSPSPSPSPLPTVTLTPSPLPTILPTELPTQPTVTVVPTAIIPTVIPTKSPIPITGPTSVMIAGILGIVTTGVGLLILLLTRGGGV